MGLYKSIIKSIIDYAVSVIGLLFIWPFLALIALINLLVFGKVFFTQIRIGKSETAFKCIKFKSLLEDGDEANIPVWGKFLRTSSIDELPQLINILRGEMSLVGPRPLLPEYLRHYSKRQQLRHKVKPGITGLAQINGRNKLDWSESLEFDAYYAENVRFGLDMKILLRTVSQLFKFSEVNSSSATSRKPFNQD